VLCRRLGKALALARHDALELLHLTSLDVAEGRFDPRHGFGLAPLDLLGQGLLPLSQPLRDFLDDAPALARVRLQFVERFCDGSLCRPLELLAQAQHRGALLIGSRNELGGLGLDPSLRVGDQLTLALLQLSDLAGEAVLRAVEVVGPGAQPLLHAHLDRYERLRELVPRLLLPLDECQPSLLGQPSFLLGEGRGGVGAGARQPALELLRSGRLLLLDHRADVGACPVEQRVGVAAAAQLPRQHRGACLSEGCPDESRRREGDLGLGSEREQHPATGGCSEEEKRHQRERPGTRPARCSRGERGRRDDDCEDKRCLQGRLEHLSIVVRHAGAVTLAEELARIAQMADRLAAAGERVLAVLPTEPRQGHRIYLCAFGGDAEPPEAWVALDGAGEPVVERRALRDAVSIAAMCELAEETAAGGDLDELRSRLVAVRMTENPPGIDEAEAAAAELQAVVGTPPQLASAARLDQIGVAARRLELALGGPLQGSPFAEAMKGAPAVVELLTADVERSYRAELR
jgi:hypothetical protein